MPLCIRVVDNYISKISVQLLNSTGLPGLGWSRRILTVYLRAICLCKELSYCWYNAVDANDDGLKTLEVIVTLRLCPGISRLLPFHSNNVAESSVTMHCVT